MIKKLSLLGFTTSVYLFSALPSFAQSVNPCPANGTGGGFQSLCNIGKGSIGPFIQQVITLLFIVAVVAATFFLIYGGIKWITSGGDKAGIETARNIIIAAAVGLILTFLTYFIINIIMYIFGLPTVNDYQLPTLQLN
jgi:hypothetical protein